MLLDVLHTIASIAGFLCTGVAVVVLVLFALAARDADDGNQAGCLGALLLVLVIGLAAAFFYAAYIT